MAGFEGARGVMRVAGTTSSGTCIPRLTETIGADGEKVWRCVGQQSEAPDRRTKDDRRAERGGSAAGLGSAGGAARRRQGGGGFALAASRYDLPGSPLRRRGARDPSGAELDASSPRLAVLRGSLTHLLLQHLPALPQLEWAAAAEALLARRGDRLAPDIRASIATETLGVLGRGICIAVRTRKPRRGAHRRRDPHPTEPGRRVLGSAAKSTGLRSSGGTS